MMRRTSLCLVTLSLALAACSSTSTPGDGETDVGESEIRACNASYARAWFVTLRDRACRDVEGRRGAWIAEPLDESAPGMCRMAWQGERYSRADMDALRAEVNPNVDAMAPACSGDEPEVAALTPIPALDVVTQVGANGCDVCGTVRRDGSVIVILPSWRVAQRQFEVHVTDGTTRAFQIQAAEGARAVSLQLPPPPAGASYVTGRVGVF